MQSTKTRVGAGSFRFRPLPFCGPYRARTDDLLHENRLFVIEVSLGSESGGFEERSGGVVDEVSESESGAA